MLINHIYYIRNFTDMRCKHLRVLSVIRGKFIVGLVREMFIFSCFKNKVKICPKNRKTVI